MENWFYKANDLNCLTLKNRQKQIDFTFSDDGVFKADKIVVNNCLENVKELETASFDTLHPIEHNKGFGFNSNELKVIYPNLVIDNAIDYNSLVTLCIKELQTLKKRLNELEGISTPCSLVSAEVTLDNIYLNNTLAGVTGMNTTSFYKKGSTGVTGPTGITGNNI